MGSNRREFLQRSIAVAVATGISRSFAAAGKSGARSGEDLLGTMKWLNEPASAQQSNGRLIVRSRPKTDFWRKTFYGYVTDNGHCYYLPVRGEFTFQARVNGNYGAQYDQAGLMVRLDEEQWMKCGSELVDGRRQASVVFTREFSDWSTLDDLSQKDAVWWRALRRKDSLEVQCSKDGVKFMSVRQGYFPPDVQVNVGLMCAAPEGQGFDAVFDEVQLSA